MFGLDGVCDLKPLERLGEPLEIMASGLAVKQYPCCGGLHSALDLVLGIKEKEGIRSEQVKEIECKVNAHRIPYNNRPRVRGGLEGKFSFQYTVATALVDGRVGLTHFPNDLLVRPEVQRLMDKVRLVPGEGFGEFACELTIQMVDGRRVTRKVSEAKGSPAFPLTESQILRKFIDCASVMLATGKAEQAGRAIMNLEQEERAGRVLGLLCQQG